MSYNRMHIKTFVKSIDDFIALEAFIKREAGEIVSVSSTPKGLLEVNYRI